MALISIGWNACPQGLFDPSDDDTAEGAGVGTEHHFGNISLAPLRTANLTGIVQQIKVGVLPSPISTHAITIVHTLAPIGIDARLWCSLRGGWG
jgi:hypothetical protein